MLGVENQEAYEYSKLGGTWLMEGSKPRHNCAPKKPKKSRERRGVEQLLFWSTIKTREIRYLRQPWEGSPDSETKRSSGGLAFP